MFLSSYGGNIPEMDDLLSPRRGFRTVMYFHTWFANKKKSHSRRDDAKRNLHHTRTIPEKLQNPEQWTDRKFTLKMLSIHAVAPVLHTFSFVGIQSCVDSYATFWQETMHVFSSYISRMLKDCRTEMLADAEKTSSAIKDSEGKDKSFKITRKGLLQFLKMFLLHSERLSPESGRVDFMKTRVGSFLTGVVFKTWTHWYAWSHCQRFPGPNVRVSCNCHRPYVRKLKRTRN